MTISFIPIGNPYHLPDIRAFAADLFLGDNAVLHGEAPVVGPVLADGQEVGGVMVFPDNGRIADQPVR